MRATHRRALQASPLLVLWIALSMIAIIGVQNTWLTVAVVVLNCPACLSFTAWIFRA